MMAGASLNGRSKRRGELKFSASDLLLGAHLMPAGEVTWGERVASRTAGVYVIETPDVPLSTAPLDHLLLPHGWRGPPQSWSMVNQHQSQSLPNDLEASGSRMKGWSTSAWRERVSQDGLTSSTEHRLATRGHTPAATG